MNCQNVDRVQLSLGRVRYHSYKYTKKCIYQPMSINSPPPRIYISCNCDHTLSVLYYRKDLCAVMKFV